MTATETAPLARAAIPTGVSGLVAVYSVTAGLGSSLLFLVQPMMARQLLPLLGGSAAVWNTAMVFFQSALLAGYLVAHLAQRTARRSSRLAVLATVALGLISLPLALPSWQPPTGDGQTWWVLAILAVSVGLPFIGLATLSPTLQRWFADTDHPDAADPYFLYAAGNVGSVVGLLAYPVLVEPLLGVSDQRRWWSVGYVITLGLCVVCAVLRRRHVGAHHTAVEVSGGEATDVDTAGEAELSPTTADRLRWIGLAAVPSGLLLGVTRHLSTDVAAVPLLWVVPLLVYLATFVIAFRRGAAPSERMLRTALLVSIPLVATMVSGIGSAVIAVGVGVSGFALMALVCHSRLAAERPPTRWLTSYYLWISFGGAVGGITVALIAPVVFTRVTEYPLLVLAALGVIGITAGPSPDARRLPGIAVVVITVIACFWLASLGPEREAQLAQVLAIGGAAAFVLAGSTRRIAVALAALVLTTMVIDGKPGLMQSRTFFGVYQVLDSGDRHVFVHGTTVHGEQIFDPEPTSEPLTYYTAESGVGRVFEALGSDPAPLSVGMVGLGAGTLASYGRSGDTMDFYEIDSEVVRIARDTRLFTYLRDSEAEVSTVVGDGRLELARSTRPLDLLVLDAFSSDAIPVHLLTVEALEEYQSRLTADGAIAVHISNRYFDLAPIMSRLAQRIDMDAHLLDLPESRWVLLLPAAAPRLLRDEVSSADWKQVPPDPTAPLWTDDFSNLLSALR